MAAHRSLLKKTNGRLGRRAGKHRFLLLHTVGRKSGEIRTTPLSYFQDENCYLLVASNWGRLEDPHWFQNLIKEPNITIQIGTTQIPVETYQARGAEYNRLWEKVCRQNRQYLKYQKRLARQIPIVVLTPVASS